MIFNVIVSLVVSLLNYLVGLLPSGDSAILAFLTSSLTAVRSLLISINFVIDVPTLGLLLGWFISIEIAILAFHVVQWVLQNVSAGFYHPTK
jgi:hypothetical protein